MGRPQRQFDPKLPYLVQNFCHANMGLMQPTEQIRETIMGLLLKYAVKLNIKLFAFTFLPHRFDILLQAEDNNINVFMANFQRDLSCALRKIHYLDGPIFTQRYTPTPVLEDALEYAVREVVALPCTENLVAHPSEWPGASSWKAQQGDEKLVGFWADSEDYWPERRKYSQDELSDEDCWERTATRYELTLSRIKPWENLSVEARRERLQEVVQPDVETRATAWKLHGRPDEDGHLHIPGVAEVLAMSPFARIDAITRRRGSRACMTMEPEAARALRKKHKENEERYIGASCRRRRGLKSTYFPTGMIPPGHRYAVGSPAAIRAGENPQDPAELAAQQAATG